MMFKEIVLLSLVVVVAQCAPQVIPIAKQGKDFPVPIVDEKTTDDFFDDRYYPDIDDERVGPKAPTGTRQKPGSKGPQPTPGGRTPPGSKGPQATPGGRTPPGSKGPQATPGGRTPPGRGGQGGKPGGKDQRTGPATGKWGKGSQGKELRIREKTTPVRQGRGNRQDLSSYKNAQPKLIFKSSQFSTNGKIPSAVKLFRTKKSEEVITTGSPTDEFVVELLDGRLDNLSLRIETMGQNSKVILRNPNRNRIVGRVKTYKNAYSG
uniref:26 kDa salivary protein n=1 Tax=Phlebotomus arabicus TaxID=578135 RepID=C6FFU1_9DIPT